MDKKILDKKTLKKMALMAADAYTEDAPTAAEKALELVGA
jgi:hypothetical protein